MRLALWFLAVTLGLVAWIPIVRVLGWGALVVAALGLFGYVYLAANAFGRWRPFG